MNGDVYKQEEVGGITKHINIGIDGITKYIIDSNKNGTNNVNTNTNNYLKSADYNNDKLIKMNDVLKLLSKVERETIVTKNNQKYYFDKYGNVLIGWKKIDSKWYYFSPGGKMLTSWVAPDGYLYYLLEDGKMVNSETTINGTSYSFLSSGRYVFASDLIDGKCRNGWNEVASNKYYCMNERIITGKQKIDNNYYFFDTNTGIMENSAKWKEIGKNYYYINDDGTMASGWKQIDSKWYYFNDVGMMAIGTRKINEDGKIDETNGVEYYFDSNGAMATGFRIINYKWYYYGPSGNIAIGWRKINDAGEIDSNGNLYYFDSSGKMVTGWKNIDGNYYYFKKQNGPSDGPMLTGFRKISGHILLDNNDSDGKWYYLDSNGIMVTGWKEINSKWYYFWPEADNDNGTMITDKCITINASEFCFDSTGICISGNGC